MNLRKVQDNVVHGFFRFPYLLHVTKFRSPKRPKQTIVLLHGIGNSAKYWDQLIPLLPKDVRIIGLDLIGFGRSPKPSRANYNAKWQARSVGFTLLKLRLTGPVILVGHSLGALVSVAVAKRYRFLVKRLVLCSPPFYQPSITKKISYERLLKDIYESARRNPDRLVSLAPLAVKAGLVSKAFSLNKDNVSSYMSALSSAIVNQTSLVDVAKLKLPILILYGSLDVVIIAKYIEKLGKSYENISVRKFIVGHEIMGRYNNLLAKEITAICKD